MSEQVYKSSRSNKLTLHTDPECIRLNAAGEITGPKPRELYPDDTKECTYCNGQVEYPSSHRPALRYIVDEEDLGLGGDA